MIYIMEYKANKATDFLILTRFFNNDLVSFRQMMDKKYCLHLVSTDNASLIITHLSTSTKKIQKRI